MADFEEPLSDEEKVGSFKFSFLGDLSVSVHVTFVKTALKPLIAGKKKCVGTYQNI